MTPLAIGAGAELAVIREVDMRGFVVAALSVVALAAPAAGADPPGSQPAPPAAEASPRHYGDFRVGFSTAGLERPVLCLELEPIRGFSIEGCGNGSGFLYRESAAELAHFRAEARIATKKLGRAWLEPQIGVGFAELQLGGDEAGFDFDGTDAPGLATSGPELSASLRARVPAGRLEMLGELSLGAAWLPHAPELAAPKAPLQPSVTATLGIGF